ncbi:hypothetical protein Tco_0478369, partial [Tanacetum coccineum]
SHSSLQVVKPNMRLHSAAAPYPSYKTTSIRIPKPSFSSNQNLVFDDVIHLPYLDIFTIRGELPTKVNEARDPDTVMSSSSTVTYTSVYTDFEPGRVFWGADEELSDGGSPRVIVYEYDGLLMQPVASPSLDYVPGPEHPPSPDYVLGPEHPPLPVEPLPADASPIRMRIRRRTPRRIMLIIPLTEGMMMMSPPIMMMMIPMMRMRSPLRTRMMTRKRKSTKLYPPPLSSPYLPPLVPTSLPLSSSPLPPLPVLLFIPPPVDRREDIPEAELPPRKRLCLTAPTSRYKVGESSTAAPRPTGGHRVDYGFIGTTNAEIRRLRAEEVGYGIRDVWVDPTEAVEKVAPTTLAGVNARVTELAAVQEQDTQDIYDMIEDT